MANVDGIESANPYSIQVPRLRLFEKKAYDKNFLEGIRPIYVKVIFVSTKIFNQITILL